MHWVDGHALGDLVVDERADGSFALDLRRGVGFRLDPVATEIVRLVQSRGRGAAAEELAATRRLPADVAARHVDRVVTTLLAAPAGRHRNRRSPTAGGAARVAVAWLRLPPADLFATVQAVMVVAAVEAGLAGQPLAAVARWVGAEVVPGASVPAPELDDDLLSPRERRALRAAARVQSVWPWAPTCLRRALVTGHVLRRRRPALRVAWTPGQAVAHAWIEVDGAAVGGLAT